MKRNLLRSGIAAMLLCGSLLTAEAQTKPVIVERGKSRITVKQGGKYTTLTMYDIAHALVYGEATQLPLPYKANMRDSLAISDSRRQAALRAAQASPMTPIASVYLDAIVQRMSIVPNALDNFLNKMCE
jgi:hypothetical protein